MAYRFSDTSKWSDEWFIDLKPGEKLMFMYLCDTCDLGGFFELSLRKLAFDLGLKNEEIKANLKGLERGFILSSDKRVLFLRNFLKHQKNLPLNPNNNSHKGILRRFDNYKDKFDIDLVKLVNNQLTESEILGACQPLPSPYGKGNGNNIEVIKEYKGIAFENFWNLYNKKVGNKKAVEKKWIKLKIDVQQKILKVLPEWKKQFSSKQFYPHPETFLNQERWNDEINIFTPEVKNKPVIEYAGFTGINHDNRD